MMPGGVLRLAFLGLAMLGVVGAMYVAAGQALERPRLLPIEAAVASPLNADYSSDPHPERPRPPLNPDIIGAAVEDLEPGPIRTQLTTTPTPVPPAPPASPTSAPLPTATPRPLPSATEEPSPTDTPEPEPSATDTPVPQPSPTATEEPKPTKTPDPCKKRPWETSIADHSDEEEPCPTATPYKTPYIIPTEIPLPR